MNIEARCAKLFAACGGAASALWLRRKLHKERQADKADVHEWENEGGNLAPSPEAADVPVTTGSA